ncbi:MAG TPA: hypothetical protein DCK98_14780 [Chloroflexi bacterium]|jgi:uncharacterized protein (DUF1015 family)|nr:hypothetical protein [Chloroflexota bacterium]HAL26913.1 hypothetical protein [Chloroflexota bacterium]
MADVVPFHALRFDESKAGPLSDLISPPYDVISDAHRDALYARSPYNVVRVEEGKDEPGDSASDNKYTRAKASLDEWIGKGILKVDTSPAFYLYDHYFVVGGQRARRRGFLGALRLYQEGRGIVRPHERTFPKAKTDRLKLLRATRTNTSPVFGLFADEKGAVASALEAWMVRGPARLVADARVGDERHLVWALDDRPVAEKLTAALKEQRVYIADGHHRYETGLAHLKEEIEAAKIDFDEDSSHFTLAYLCALDDPGLRIFGTHRVVSGADAAIDEIVPRNFDTTVIDRGAPGDTQSGIVLVRNGAFTALTPKADLDLSAMPESWRTLPVARAEELLVQPARALGGEVTYEHDTEKAIAAARDGTTTVLLRAVEAETLKKVADSWEHLPQKTTYFYPKVPAGLVLRPLGD